MTSIAATAWRDGGGQTKV